jgi:hypothetical protein
MNCTECREKLVDLLEGLLPESQKQIIKEHLKDCRRCREELKELTELHERITSNGKAWQQTNLEDAVFGQIIRKQSQRLKQADGIHRQFRIWRQIMNSRITKYAAAAVIIIAAIFAATVFNKTTSTAAAAQVLQDAIDAVSDLWSVHMKAQMRTRPGDNFSNIGIDYDFVEIKMWKRIDLNEQVQWRVEKPGRVLLMNGQTTIMFIRPNYGVLQEEPWPLGCYDSWSGRLLNVRELLDNELRNAKNHPDREIYLRHEEIEGKDKIILEVDITTDVDEDDYLRNTFISDSDHLKVYRFDAETKLLEALQVYVHTADRDVLIFEVTDIEYNSEIDDDVFTLDLPEDMIWHKEPEILPDNKRYEEMTPREAAQAFFQACAEENWEEVLKFWTGSRIDDDLKEYLGGLKIMSLGEPFKSKGYTRTGWFVPYEIRLKSGEIKKFNLAIRKDNPARRFVVDGGI